MRSMGREEGLLIPENLDIDKVIDQHKDELVLDKFNNYKALYIVDAILRARSNQRKEMLTPFANVSSKILEGVVKDYPAYIQFLLFTGVISTDDHFIPGVKCKGYCLNVPYVGQKLKLIPLEDYNLRKAINSLAVSFICSVTTSSSALWKTNFTLSVQ